MTLKYFCKPGLGRLVSTVMILLCFYQVSRALPADVYTFSSEQENQRFLHLTKELRCLVCQNQSLADSDAALAKDLRDKIYLMIKENKSDDEIRQFLVGRYGDFILFSPPLKPSTLLLWGFPVILLTVVFGGFLLKRRDPTKRRLK